MGQYANLGCEECIRLREVYVRLRDDYDKCTRATVTAIGKGSSQFNEIYRKEGVALLALRGAMNQLKAHYDAEHTNVSRFGFNSGQGKR